MPAFLPIAAGLANIVVPILADKLLPQPKLELADRLAMKRKELFDLTTSRASQQFVDAAEILGDTIDSKSRGGAFGGVGELREVQRGVNRATDANFRQAGSELTRGAIDDERTEILADFQQESQSRENTIRAIGSGLQSFAGFAALDAKSKAMRDALKGLNITSGANNTDLFNLDFDTDGEPVEGFIDSQIEQSDEEYYQLLSRVQKSRGNIS